MCPDYPVTKNFFDSDECNVIGNGVTTVELDALQHKVRLFTSQESILIREIR